MGESVESVQQFANGGADSGTAGSIGPNTEPLVTSDTLAENERERPTCRICLDDEECKSLIRPCRCRGTMQYVHIECLKAWRQSASKQSMRGGIACEQCQFEYVDALKWRHPYWTAVAPMAIGIVGGVLQVLPIGLELLSHFAHGTKAPHDFCTPPKTSLTRVAEVAVLPRFWEKVLRLILLSAEPSEPASGYAGAPGSATNEPIPLLECITPGVLTGFLAAFFVSVYHLTLRAARTAYPPLRLAHAALLEPAQGLSVVWSLRSGMITYELLSRRLMDRGRADPGLLYLLFAVMPFLLPEPLETVIQDLGDIKLPNQEMKESTVRS